MKDFVYIIDFLLFPDDLFPFDSPKAIWFSRRYFDDNDFARLN